MDFPGGSGEELKASIERVATLDIELVLTGHGPIVKGAKEVKANFDMIRKFYFGMI